VQILKKIMYSSLGVGRVNEMEKEAGTILANRVTSDCVTDHRQVQFILLIREQ